MAGRCVVFGLCVIILASCSLATLGDARITLEELWRLVLAAAAILSVFPGLWAWFALAWPYVVEVIAIASLTSVVLEIVFGRPKRECLYAWVFYTACFLALSWRFDLEGGEKHDRKN